MTDDETPAPRPGQPRVVKKVVKRTVVRPATTQRTSAARTSRPVGAKATVETKPTPAAPTRRPSIDLGKVRQTGSQWKQRSGRGATAGLSWLRRAASRSKQGVSNRYWDARTYRLPAQPPLRSALVVGLLLGAFVVTVGWLSGLLFTLTRGTSSGGGLWGGLVVVTLAVLTVWAGARLLGALRVANAATVSLLAVFLVLIAILMFFLDLASGPWAWLLVPLLTSASYAVALLLTTIATTSPSESEVTE